MSSIEKLLLTFGMVLVGIGAIAAAVSWSWITIVGAVLVLIGGAIVVYVGETTKP